MVSIIIPTKNSANTLEYVLSSIMKQSFKDFEIIVVDNYSVDNTREIAKRYGARVYLVHGERSAQKNYGAKIAKGKYLYFIDSDFYLHPKVLEECIDIVSKGFDAVIVLNISNPRVSIWSRIRYFERLSYYMSNIYEAARFIKKDLFMKVGGFDEKLYANEDYDLHLRLLKSGAKIAHTVKSFEIHLGEPKNIKEIILKFIYYGHGLAYFLEKNPLLRYLSPLRYTYLKKEFVAYAVRKWAIAIPLIIYLKIVQLLSSVIGVLFKLTMSPYS